MKKIVTIVLFLLSLNLWGIPYTVGSKMEPMDLEDQFGVKYKFTAMPELFIIAFEKETSAVVNECLSKQKSTYLSSHKAKYIADISQMPTFVADAFALPKMRKYPYVVLLIRDEEAGLKFPSQNQKITLIRSKDNIIQSIDYVSSEDELKTAIEK